MRDWIGIAAWALVSGLRSRRNPALENLALRRQLMVLQRQKGTVRLKDRDRVFWMWRRSVWPDWRRTLVLVQPATVVGWHRKGFRSYWRRKGRPTGGRPGIDPSVRRVIHHMWSSNPTWGALRIQAHDRRRILHCNITTSPSAEWTARQVLEAFPYDTKRRFLLHDRDRVFAGEVARRVRSMGIEEVLTAPGSPWQNAYCERLIGSIRRECLDHVVVLNERHLLRVLQSCASYYHASRTHRALDGDSPDGRAVEPPEHGKVIAYPQVGGIHHLYARRAP